MIWVSQYHEMRMTSHDAAITSIKPYQRENNQVMIHRLIPMCLTQADTIASVVFFLCLVLLFFAAPFVILIILYILIINHLLRDTSISFNSCNTSDSYHSRARRQVVYMQLAMAISFFICLSPYRFLILYIVITPAEQIAVIDHNIFFGLLNFSRIMLYLNSASNPLLYNLMSSKFRQSFLKLCGFRKIHENICRNAITSTRQENQKRNKNQEENFV